MRQSSGLRLLALDPGAIRDPAKSSAGISPSVRFLYGAILGVMLATPSAHATGANNWDECLHAPDPDERAEACTEIIGNTRDRKALVRALTGRGDALCATELRCREAIPDFSSVIRLEPKIAGYQDNLARALRAASRYEEAIQASDVAIELAPKFAFVYVGKARTLAAAGRGIEALDTLKTAIALAPADAGLVGYEGELLGKLKRFSESYAAFDRALQMAPTHVSLYARRADVEIAEGRTKDAIHDLEHYPADGNEAAQVQAKLDVLRSLPSRVEPPVSDTQIGSSQVSNVQKQVDPPPTAVITKPLASTASCNLYDWQPIERCVEEYHNENDPLLGGARNPRHWNDQLAAQGHALAESHPEITWDKTAWNKLAAEQAARTVAKASDADTLPPETAASHEEPEEVAAPLAIASAGAIATCDAPSVLSVIRRLSDEALKKGVFALLLANITDAHFEFSGIRQISFDPDNEHRMCAMDRKLDVTYDPQTYRPAQRLNAPIRYEVDRQLDGDRGSYVTCKCD